MSSWILAISTSTCNPKEAIESENLTAKRVRWTFQYLSGRVLNGHASQNGGTIVGNSDTHVVGVANLQVDYK